MCYETDTCDTRRWSHSQRDPNIRHSGLRMHAGAPQIGCYRRSIGEKKKPTLPTALLIGRLERHRPRAKEVTTATDIDRR
jgi:hypothetical protein